MNESLWIESARSKAYDKLTEHIEIDCVIIGGGIVGVTTAYLLSKNGVKVALVDANNIGGGCSGRNTGKVTTQHNIIYSKIEEEHGIDYAKKYYEANNHALKFIEDIIKENNINCDFKKNSSYIFTEDESYINEIKKEYEVCREVGIPCSYHETLDIPFDVRAAISFKDQGEFNPKKYIDAMGELVIQQGGIIYENTPIVDFINDGKIKLKAKNGCIIDASRAVLSSHVPWYDGMGLYFARLRPERSYIVAGAYEGKDIEGMYINVEDNRRSFKLYEENGETLLLLGGENHKVGQGDNDTDYYEILKSVAKEKFNVSSIKYQWSAQDYITPDYIPYVGYINVYDNNVFVATGFSKWGMTNGTAAAMILSDLLTIRESKYKEVFSPERIKSIFSAEVLKENINVASEYIKGKLEGGDKELPTQCGEGKIVKINRKRYGAYIDDNGELFIVDITCTHLGCELNFNNIEKTWDCPCHGSRFNYNGEVYEGPATKPLLLYNRGKNEINPHII